MSVSLSANDATNKVNDQLKRAAALWQSTGASSALTNMARAGKQKAQQLKGQADAKAREAKNKLKQSKKKAAAAVRTEQKIAEEKARALASEPLQAFPNPGDAMIAQYKAIKNADEAASLREQSDQARAAATALSGNADRLQGYLTQISEISASDRSPKALAKVKQRLARDIQSDDELPDDQKESLLAQLSVSTDAPFVAQTGQCLSASYSFEITEFERPVSVQAAPSDDNYNDQYAQPAADLH